MSDKLLTLEYKGTRDYLHGTDIFNNTVDWLKDQGSIIKDIDFSFHRLARHQLQAISGSLPETTEPVAVCAFTIDGSRERIQLIETDQEVTGRYPYPEDELVSGMEIDLGAQRGELRGEVAYSDIEVWVAMTKALHYKVFPHLQGKWLFVRGRFPQFAYKTKAETRTMVIAASFNDKLTRSEAFLDGVKVGEIFFSIA